MKYSESFLKKEAKKYKSRGEFQKKSKTLYEYSRSHGFLDKICSHMKIIKPRNWTKNQIINFALKCNSYNDFISKHPNIYVSALRKNIKNEIINLFPNGNNGFELYKERIKLKNIELLNNIIKCKKGIFLNEKKFINHSTLCKIKCSKNHIFTLRTSSIKRGSWCPKCLNNINHGEEISRIILEEFLGIKLTKTRKIKDLKSTKNKPLEIDGFNYSNKIGFEYNGPQHYNFIAHVSKTKEEFKNLIINDKSKVKHFKKNKWKLIIIPYFKNFNTKENIMTIRDILKKQKINFKEIDFIKVENKIRKTLNK